MKHKDAEKANGHNDGSCYGWFKIIYPRHNECSIPALDIGVDVVRHVIYIIQD